MNCKLCRIIRSDLDFIVVAHRFLQMEKLFNFDTDTVEHRILIVSRYWWEISHWLGSLVAGGSELLLLRRIFIEWILRVASCCFYIIFSDSYLLYKDNLSLFGRKNNDFHISEMFPFLGTWCKFQKTFVFQLFVQSNFYRQLWVLIRGICSSQVIFSDTLSAMLIPLNNFPRKSVTIIMELVPFELFSQTSTFILVTSF